MLKEPRKRTEKVFEEYYDYYDRGMAKWVTAFAMEELAKSISVGKEEALKDVPNLPQMSPFEIDVFLAESIQKNRLVSIQLNQKDCFGRQTESMVDHFRGYLAESKILIDTEWILLKCIRNVHILHDEKWFKIHVFTKNKKDGLNSTREFSNLFILKNKKLSTLRAPGWKTSISAKSGLISDDQCFFGASLRYGVQENQSPHSQFRIFSTGSKTILSPNKKAYTLN